MTDAGSFTPITVEGVITEEIGDSARSRGLMRVPIRMSRSVSIMEGRLLKEIWANPPEFTMRHAPDIAHIEGYRFTLDPTTLEDVRDVHARTVSLVLDKFNTRMPDVIAARVREREATEQAEAEKQRRIEQVAAEIKFD